MKNYEVQELREKCFNQTVFPREVLEWIATENLWNLWVPKDFGGLELSITDGLQQIRSLTRIDGSLGWTVTLCSGANYFIGNLQPEVAEEIFLNPVAPVCFGGSGGAFGTAEKYADYYKISGTWRYATGAPYLSHFTLNARILENGKEIRVQDGSPIIRSFVVPRKEVRVIEDWNTMGLKTTASHSFEVNDMLVHEKYGFHYNQFHLPQPIFKIPFGVFTDLTLWANYIGMAEHFLEESRTIATEEKLTGLPEKVADANRNLQQLAEEVDGSIHNRGGFTPEYINKVHSIAASSVSHISKKIIAVYPFLGMRACNTEQYLNQVFRDYFTATQHRNFSST